MGLISRCPLSGVPCSKSITIEGKSFFLAEAAEPEYDRKRRKKAIQEAVGSQYNIRSALDGREANIFSCEICEMVQSCAYGIADITQDNANVALELGMMLALGKPTIVLLKKGQEPRLKLSSDFKALETIYFEEYLDIIDQLRDILERLPPSVSPPAPVEELEAIKPPPAEELENMEAGVVREFEEGIKQAEPEAISVGEGQRDMPVELSERLSRLQEKLDELARSGFREDAETAFLRGNFYYNQGRYEEALEAYTRSLEMKDDDPVALCSRGTTRYRLGKYDEALLDYNRSLELRPDHVATLYNRGNAYAELGRLDRALLDYDRSLALKPNHPDTLCNRGITYDELGQYDEALADYNRSLEMRPNHPTTLGNRGTTYSKLGRHDKALADYNRSLELRPNHPLTLYNRGTTYARLGKYEEALADYKRVLELKPDDPSTLYNLACLFALRGKSGEALTYLEKAISRDEKYRQMARTDKDLDNIRNESHFKNLTGSGYFLG